MTTIRKLAERPGVPDSRSLPKLPVVAVPLSAFVDPLPPGVDLVEIPWPSPCPRCGSYQAWWDFRGRQHCQVCDAKPFLRGLRLAACATKLRRAKR
jgi:hypothetical protein